ncbi:MAG: DNA-binding response regulator [Hyphomicrobiales bacterium]|jgi:DNA-binding NarL/FixJ family response regulator|nr:DNA-binding response regulator [Hyphomicrobiales bacterium]
MLKIATRLSILLADDHPVVLQGLSSLLSEEPDMRVVATCADGLQALGAIHDHRPDIAILDLNMPGMSGIEILSAVRREGLRTRIVFLTASATDQEIARAVEGGADALCFKDTDLGGLTDCLRRVSRGRKCCSGEMIQLALAREESRRVEYASFGKSLTSREIEVARAVGLGLVSRAVANQLHISEGTVKVHLNRIYQKLGVNNRTALANKVRDVLADH